ncbi:MAG: DUF1501 domain-containing protein [Bacteroidetes bacterium]|nr:MAG: DUF1501 domain-containing protein [Bacteroidota bacterium]
MQRRKFLKNTGLIASGTLLVPGFLKAGYLNAGLNTGGKKLVVIQLSGGNDGLNTVVPFASDDYYKARPFLGLKDKDIIRLDDYQALNANLSGLADLYNQGDVCVLNSVGYPNPNRSHFRSMDIWQSASDSDEYVFSGWLGRYLDHNCSNAHDIIEIGNTLSLAMKGDHGSGLAMKDAKTLYRTVRDDHFGQLSDLAKGHTSGAANLDFLYKTMVDTQESAKYVYEKTKVYNSKAEYPMNAFAKSLKTVAEFIQSGVETQVYYVSLNGFDTHVNQKGTHGRLLKTYGDGVKAFVDDLKQSGHFKDTLIMTFSEFGRRIKQNASGGTDHGKANNMFLIGDGLNGAGIFNKMPDLSKADKGDIAFEIDFRRVYGEVIDQWMGASSGQVLGRDFKSLGII